MLGGFSTIGLILLLLAAIYIYLLFYNTKTAIAIAIGIFTLIFKVIVGIGKLLIRFFSALFGRSR